jgi:uncharacterized oligopeptide transporter (OPT) family protein
MTADDIRSAYVLYIGAGAVAAAGITSLLRSLPTIWSSCSTGLKDFRGGAASRASLSRTDRDLSMKSCCSAASRSSSPSCWPRRCT